MAKQFYCDICEMTFLSGYEMAQHFRSKEHRDKASGGNLDSLIEKFVKGVKAAIDPDQTNKKN